MQATTKIVAIILFFAITSPSTAQQDKQTKEVENGLLPWVQLQDSALTKYSIEERMKYYQVPAVSIAVIDGGKLAWAKAYGLADINSQMKATVNTLFQAASISKPVNALLVMRMVQKQKLSLDEDIRHYLKSWKFPDNEFSAGRKITLKNLLSHSAGLGVHGFKGYKISDTLPQINQVLDGTAPANNDAVKLVMQPGIKYQYSGGGTVIIRKILEDNIDTNYVKLIERAVLQPLGMKHSSFAQPLSRKNATRAATAYTGNSEEVPGKWYVYPELAPDGLWTTPTDLAKMLIAVQQALQGKNEKFLGSVLARQMLTPYLDSTKSALGFFIMKKGGEQFFRHDGGNEGFSSDAYATMDNGKGVVVMINSDNYLLIDEIVNSVATVYGWKDFYQPVIRKLVPVSDTILQSYTGEYFFDSSSSILVRKVGTTLEIKGESDPYWERMFPVAENRFFLYSNQLDYSFSRNGDRMVLELSNGRKKMQAVSRRKIIP